MEDPSKNTTEYMENKALKLLELPEEELKTLAEAGKKKQAEEEAKAIKDIAREHQVG